MSAVAVTNAMSVDVEDYFHASVFDDVVSRDQWDSMESRVVANTRRLLAIFGEFGVRATFFVLGWVAKRHPQLVREIAAAGHELASHGYGHRLIYQQTPQAFREDVRRAKGVIENTGGTAVHGYRAPTFSVTTRSLWALDVLIEEGHRYDASIFPIRHDRYGIPDSSRHPYLIRREAGVLTETPGATVRVGATNLPIGGGGYFRLLPYQWTRWGISRVNRREGQPVVFYLHPWEIDAQQPRLDVGRLAAVRHYRNLEKTESRLKRLLTDFRFGTIEALVHALHQRAADAGEPHAESQVMDRRQPVQKGISA
jgi:polysaccharide deacetylase family protein (PEP-CTERM system associated)